MYIPLSQIIFAKAQKASNPFYCLQCYIYDIDGAAPARSHILIVFILNHFQFNFQFCENLLSNMFFKLIANVLCFIDLQSVHGALFRL